MATNEIKTEDIMMAFRVTAEEIIQHPSVREELATPEGEKQFRKDFVNFQKKQFDGNNDNKVGTHELAVLSLVGASVRKDTDNNGIIDRDEARANVEQLVQRGIRSNLSVKDIEAAIRTAIPEEGLSTTAQDQALIRQTEVEANALLAKPDKVIIKDLSAVLNQSVDIAIKKLRAGEFPEQPDNANSEIRAPRQPEGTQRPTVSSGRKAG